MMRIRLYIIVAMLAAALVGCSDKPCIDELNPDGGKPVDPEEPTIPVVPVSDANFKKYLVLFFDRDDDGEISTDEALLITQIDCFNRSVKSLSGVEHFVNLTTLKCTNNQLMTLDVSKLTKLIELDCGNNQITALNISANTELSELSCDDNKLTILDVQKLTKLTKLKCNGNLLTTLDISANTKLTLLNCSDNLLTTLNVSNTNLVGSEFTYPLDCSPMNNAGGENVLKTLTLKSVNDNISGISPNRYTGCIPTQTTIEYEDVEEEPEVDIEPEFVHIPDFSFKGDMIRSYDKDGDGEISTDEALLVRQLILVSSSIKSLEGVKSFVNLEGLNCNYNELTTLDVSKLTKLTNLSCNDNQITALNVSGCAALTKLSCEDNEIATLDVSSTNLGSSGSYNPLYCSPMNNASGENVLKTLTLKTGWRINGIYPNRDDSYIPDATMIQFKD